MPRKTNGGGVGGFLLGAGSTEAFAGSDEELARLLQQEELSAAAARTRNRAKKLPELPSLESVLPLSPTRLAPQDSLQANTSTPLKQQNAIQNAGVPAGGVPAGEAAPSHSPSSRQDTGTVVAAPSVPSSATPASRKRRAVEPTLTDAAAPAPPCKRFQNVQPQRSADESGKSDHEKEDSEDKDEDEDDGAPAEGVSEAGEEAAEEAKEEPDAAAANEAAVGHAPRSSRNRRKRSPPDAAPAGASPSVSSGGRGSDGQTDAHAQQEPPQKAPPKRRRNRGGPRKLPKLPMVRHLNLWYRARTIHDDGAHITLELMGFQGLGSVLVLPLDSDRLWRGSYKGKDWKHVGDGAWVPKVPMHKTGGRGNRRGHHARHLHHSNHTHTQASGHTSGRTDSGGHMSGLESDAQSSDDDHDRGEDPFDRHGDDKVNEDVVHPYGSVGDQNWPGDGTLKADTSAPSNLAAPSPRRRKSINKPTRAPMDADIPPVPVQNPLQISPNGMQLLPENCLPPLPPHLGSLVGSLRDPVAGSGAYAHVPSTPPMPPVEGIPETPGVVAAEEAHGEGASVRVVAGNEQPQADAVALDATEMELMAAEAMMTCMAECTWHMKESTPMYGNMAGEDDEEAAVALLGESALRHQVDASMGYGIMLTPRKPGGPRGGRPRRAAGGPGGARRGKSTGSGPTRGGPSMRGGSSLTAFSALLGALGDLERGPLVPPPATMIAKQRLDRVLAFSSDALTLPFPLGMHPLMPSHMAMVPVLPSVPLFFAS